MEKQDFPQTAPQDRLSQVAHSTNAREMMMTIEEAIKRERLSDELRGLLMTNAAKLPGETYEQNLERRAKIKMRIDEILSEFAW